jgi:RecB family exonuclease
MHAELLGYLLWARASQGPAARSIHFELGFGLEAERLREHADALDPRSREEPVALDAAGEPVRIRGKIDRVDRVAAGDRTGLLVVDYKTGRLLGARYIDAGRSLQLPLYAAAAEDMLAEESFGGAFHQVAEHKERHFSRLRRPRGQEGPYDERLAAALATVGRFVAGIRAGRFDALPTHECPSYCPYGQICHYSEARAAVKAGAEAGRDER